MLMGSDPWLHIPGEYRRFTEWITAQIDDGAARFVERPEGERFIAAMQTRYLQHIGSEAVWRLDEPDGPFRGSFCLVVRDRLPDY